MLISVRYFPISTGCRKADEEEGYQGNHLYDGVYVWIYRQQG
jgi:hypothetical protein